MENRNVTANVDVEFVTAKVLFPTPIIRWYKPNMTAILQQYWRDGLSGTGEWRDVEIVREI